MSKADRRKAYELRVKDTVEANIKAHCGADTKLPWTKRQRRELYKIKDPVEQAKAWEGLVQGNALAVVTVVASVVAPPVSPKEVSPKEVSPKSANYDSRMAKLESAQAVIADWNGVLKWIRGMEDGPEKAEAMRTLMVLTKALRGFGEDYDRYNLTDIVNGLWNGIQRIEDSERIENMRIEG